MATEHIISLLIAERDKLNKAIEALGGTAPRAAATPKPVEAPATAPSAPAKKNAARKQLTSAQKKAHSDRMKAFWAAKRKKSAKS